MNILVVDDEKLIIKGLKHSLEQNGYVVFTAYDGKQALDIITMEKIDIILLDIMLPEIDGFTICKKIREKRDIPIIMLTARDDFIDKILGLEFGADDYVTKPFHTRELIARINAVYRRYNKKISREEVIKVENIIVNIVNRTVNKDNIEINFTAKEFDLLQTLIMSPGRIFSRENLFQIVWNEFLCDTRTVDVHISNIRDKLEDDPSNPKYIKTKWGVGYFFMKDNS